METDEVLALLKDVAEQVVNPRFGNLESDQIGSKKHRGDLVTVADREAEVLIAEALRRSYPHAMMLGEEATAADPSLPERFRTAEHAFTIDPVDGTRNFVKGSPDHAVMVSEVRSAEVVRSWIWQPQHHTSYVAERGAGAWRDGERLTRAPSGDDLRGVTSRRSWIGRALGTLRSLDITWVCCGVDYPKVIEGAADYAVYLKALPWDHCPGSLLLTEAGGHVGTFHGEEYRPQAPDPRGLIAAADLDTYRLVQGLVHRLPEAR